MYLSSSTPNCDDLNMHMYEHALLLHITQCAYTCMTRVLQLLMTYGKEDICVSSPLGVLELNTE